ncbi:MAG: transcriptional regulator [Rhodospirillaceae bacterium]|jgi:predicted DNA-binding transcriptional regulator AlpA|nr:transcriptional regulator [Rhodospirillaceae bacterium]MBT5243397.1 transcriptional regulator [Rhodospirillaceae bacterium]MBT5561302.1 transcriptional regulator [Rhodospirillaceae bacterium]MBT6243377.1 transcriptional regulator [Rhodospirillaceae bacterium]MBT7139003.1 transcriptional regulator [Rhodospirillaceae bacterium]
MIEITNSPTKQTATDRICGFDDLPDGALTEVSEISFLARRSRASIWRDVNHGRLAKPHKVGPNATRWYVGDVRLYLKGDA